MARIGWRKGQRGEGTEREGPDDSVSPFFRRHSPHCTPVAAAHTYYGGRVCRSTQIYFFKSPAKLVPRIEQFLRFVPPCMHR